MNSNLGKTINNISYASKMYDNIVKELFADKQVLANVLKYSLDEFMDMSIPDIIAEMGETKHFKYSGRSGMYEYWKC